MNRRGPKPKPRVGRVMSERLANTLVCDALAGLAAKTRAGHPIVQLHGRRYALCGTLVQGELLAIDAVGAAISKAYNCEGLVLFPTRTNPDRATYTSDDVEWVTPAPAKAGAA